MLFLTTPPAPNMDILDTEMAADMPEVIADFADELTFGSETAQGCFSTAKTSDTLQPGGELLEYVATWTGLSTSFTTAPVQGDKVTVNSVVYRVVSIERLPANTITLMLDTPHKA